MKYVYFFIPRVKMKSISLKKRLETGYYAYAGTFKTLSSNELAKLIELLILYETREDGTR